MEYFLYILAILLATLGIVGSVVPPLPGPPLGFAALICLQYAYKPFGTTFLVVWGIIILATVVFDYIFPIWFAKKFGATKAGIWGSVIGMFVGMFLTPIGMLMGMLLGAIIGDLVAGKDFKQSLKSGLATFVGTMLSIGLKLMISITLTVYTIYYAVKGMMQ